MSWETLAHAALALEGLCMTKSFWRGKRVLITGHTGFKGAWLSLWLQRLGADLSGFSLPPRTPDDLFEVAGVGDGMSSTFGDVRNLPEVKAALSAFQPEIVFHLAAQALVRASYRDPVATYATNVMGTAHLLEAIRSTASVRTVICVTSDKCYENREWTWGYREIDPLGGHDPYSSSKGCSELVVSAYRRSYFSEAHENNGVVGIATARAGNVIGGGDWGEDRLVPDLFRAILDQEPARIRNPLATRPWQHVLDPLAGYLSLAERLWTEAESYSSSWNFGPERRDARPVSWIADGICDRWGNGATWVGDDGPHPHESHHLHLDCSKAHRILDWTPRIDLNTALDWCVEWYRGRAEDQNVRELSEGQIDRFFRLDHQ